MNVKYYKYLKLIRTCQSLLYENDVLLPQEKRLLELCIFSLMMGKSKIDWQNLKINGLLCKNDWRWFKKMIQNQMPEIRTWKQFHALYE